MPDRVNRLSFLLLLKLLFGEPTWFYVVHPDLDPTLGIATGVKGAYILFYVGANGRLWSKISQRKLKKIISYSIIHYYVSPKCCVEYIMYLGSQYDMYRYNLYLYCT